MIKPTRHILKAEEVAICDPFHLDLHPAVPPAGPEAPPAGPEAPPAGTGPRVRIAQNHPQHAIIEVTCPCGKTTYIRCEYDTGKGPV